MSLKICIVGGVAGGATAAARLRRLDEEAEIIMFERGEHISFANCGLPYYIGGVITDKDELLVQTPEKMKARFNIDVRTHSEVTRIFSDQKTIEVQDKKRGKTYIESYDRLLLSPGAEPVRPNIPGIDSERIFTLRNIPDTFRIKEYVDEHKPMRAVVIGAGFIGLEVAENLHLKGIKTTLVEMADHVIGPLDLDMAAIVHQHMKSIGVEFYLKDAVKSFLPQDSFIEIHLQSGKVMKADMAVVAIGVKPEVRLALDAGLKLGSTGGIMTDSHMRTSDPYIYAVGDAVESVDFVSGKPALIPLAGPANKQARIAAGNMLGIDEEYKGTQGTSIVKVFDMTVAITGSNEKTLIKNEIEYEKSLTHSPSHAGYYPEAASMSIKLFFSTQNGKVLGAQIVGFEGVDKRIDVLATAIRAGMTVYDLEKLELAYAPPYSSAKDPVNIAGFAAANVLKGHSKLVHWDKIASLDPAKVQLVDVRTKEEYDLGTIEGALNIPLDELRNRLDEISKDKGIYVFCQVGLRAYVALRILAQKGFKNVMNLSGGYKTYELAMQNQSNIDLYEYDLILKDDEIRQAKCQTGTCCGNETLVVDACGLQCPEPIIRTYKAINTLNFNESLTVKSTDPAFEKDIRTWCEKTGNKLLAINFEQGVYSAAIRKERQERNVSSMKINDSKTMVIFSNDLDKAIASFIIANGAAAMGRKVTMFFTFWGLNILRSFDKTNVKKDLFGRMFGLMMPKGSRRLSLSKMNMGGMGAAMIRFIMRKKNVASLEDLIAQAQANGIELIACNMSMDIMGIKREELIEGVQIGGVASFLGSAEESDMTLFI
jgi:NADPH-dependent 2,4-dienoyl-CoA reductase/sulfur reductase-like enzyme/peroxiredoxin family protein/rhodanese-related sulfurtransferase/TusA-related sulfurtransferase